MNFVTVTFDRDHTHAGQPVKRGESRSIPQYNADWLIAHGVAHAKPLPTTPRRGDTTTEEDDHVE